MKFLPPEGALFLDLPVSLKKSHDSVSLCEIDHWECKRDQFLVAVADNLEPAQVVFAALDKNINHLLQKNPDRFAGDVFAAGKLAEASNDYFQSQYKVFTEPVAGELVLRFKGPEDKEEMKKQSLAFVGGIQSPAVSQAAESIIEELYMNAVFDAPREAVKFGGSDKQQMAEIFLAHSSKSLQISCSDLFGSLDVSKFLRRMNEIYEKGVGNAINLSVERGAGAGIGCVILFENCTSLILGVRHGKITKVTCVIPLGMRSRQREQMKKSLHWFEI